MILFDPLSRTPFSIRNPCLNSNFWYTFKLLIASIISPENKEWYPSAPIEPFLPVFALSLHLQFEESAPKPEPQCHPRKLPVNFVTNIVPHTSRYRRRYVASPHGRYIHLGGTPPPGTICRWKHTHVTNICNLSDSFFAFCATHRPFALLICSGLVRGSSTSKRKFLCR